MTIRIHERDLEVTASEHVGSVSTLKTTGLGKKRNTKNQKCFYATELKGRPFIQHLGILPTFIFLSVQQSYKSSKETASMLERVKYTRHLSLQKYLTGNVKELCVFNSGAEKVRYSLCLLYSLDVLTAIAAAVALRDLLQKSQFLIVLGKKQNQPYRCDACLSRI